MREADDEDGSWEKRLAKKYYDKLFKEYCLADMSRSGFGLLPGKHARSSPTHANVQLRAPHVGAYVIAEVCCVHSSVMQTHGSH